MLDRIEFLFGEAFVALRRNGLMTFAAISTVAVSLFLLGGLGYVYWRVAQYAQTIPGKFEMRVFLKDDATQADVQKTAQQLREIPGISGVNWIPKDKAWEAKKKQDPSLMDTYENPYPEAFKVRVQDLAESDRIADQIRALPTVTRDGGVVYLKEEQDFVDNALRLVRWLGAVFGGLLFLTGGVLIYNAIRLTLVARRVEIRIMQLVGASHFTIRVPFLIEGLVQGALGGLVATFMVLASNQVIANFILSLKSDAGMPQFPLWVAMGSLCGAGAVYGLLCSVIAVRGPLKLR